MQALAQDQLRSLLAMAKGFDSSLSIGIYDGDTSQTDRIWLRENARLVLFKFWLSQTVLFFYAACLRLY